MSLNNTLTGQGWEAGLNPGSALIRDYPSTAGIPNEAGVYRVGGGLYLSIGLVAESTSAAVDNVAKLQAALDACELGGGGTVSISIPGNYYFPGMAASAVFPAFPAQIAIGSNTSFVVDAGVNFLQVPGSRITAFIANKNFLANKTTVTGWNVPAITHFGHLRLVSFTVDEPMNIQAGDYVIIGGDLLSGAGLDDGYQVHSVNVDGAATEFVVATWKDDFNGLTKNALDTVYAYPCDANFSIEIKGSLTTIDSGGGTWVQGERGVCMFNKTKNMLFSANCQNTVNAKTVVVANCYSPKFPRLDIYNSGAGLTVLSPAKGVSVDTLVKHGGEDAFLLQTYGNPGGVTMSMYDADGTMSSGDISGFHVNRMFIDHQASSCFTVQASSDINDTNLRRNIDGIRIDYLHLKTGGMPGSVGYLRTAGTANGVGVGGNCGVISIGKLVYEDTSPVNAPPIELFTYNGFNSPTGAVYWGGIVIDNFETVQANDNPVCGVRNRFLSVGSGIGAGSVFNEITIKSANIEFDQQNVTANMVLVYGGSAVTINKVCVDGTFQTVATLQGLAISAAGAGYTNGDILYINGGTPKSPAKIRVDAVSGGAITAISVLRKGKYKTLPTSPAAATGGAGSGATFSFTNTLYSVIFAGGSAGAIINNFIAKKGAYVDLLGNSYFVADPSGATCTVDIDDVKIKNLYQILGLNSAKVLHLNNTDLSLVTNQISVVAASQASAVTHDFVLGGNKFKSDKEIITLNNSLSFAGMTINIRSKGGNIGAGTTTTKSLVYRTYSSVTLNFIGNCADIVQNFSYNSGGTGTGPLTIGRIDGGVVNEGGGTAGAPGPIGPGIVACFGTAAGSWKPLNPALSANSL